MTLTVLKSISITQDCLFLAVQASKYSWQVDADIALNYRSVSISRKYVLTDT